MGIVQLTEPYAIRNARKAVRESLMAHGEEVIALRMYHVYTDEGVQPRCPVCFDDIYRQGDKADCTACYGTTFEGGIKELTRVWGMFTITPSTEQKKRRGEWQEKDKVLQTEYLADLVQNDYVFRVAQWSQDHRPLRLGAAYVLGRVDETALYTGNQVGQNGNDRIGYRTTVTELSTDHIIYRAWNRDILPTVPVLRTDGLPR